MTHTTVKSIDELHTFATAFVATLTPRRDRATIVGLSGELGAGKTAFVQGVARALGIEEVVSSPTFVLMKVYALPPVAAFSRLVHIDAYRIENFHELRHLGWEELASDPRNIVVIEWVDRVEEILPPDTIRLSITADDEHTRTIETRLA